MCKAEEEEEAAPPPPEALLGGGGAEDSVQLPDDVAKIDLDSANCDGWVSTVQAVCAANHSSVWFEAAAAGTRDFHRHHEMLPSWKQVQSDSFSSACVMSTEDLSCRADDVGTRSTGAPEVAKGDSRGPVRVPVVPTQAVVLLVAVTLSLVVSCAKTRNALKRVWELVFETMTSYVEVKRLGFDRKEDYDEYKRLGFIEKAHYDEYKMLNFTDKEAYEASRTCQICDEDISDPDERIGCAVGHNTCLSCALGTITNALGDHASNIHPEGIRCVRHPRSLGGCPEFLSEALVERVHNLSNRRGLERALSHDQLRQVRPFITEANVTAAVPSECLVVCPSPACGQLIWIDQHSADVVTATRSCCPYCNAIICLDCHVPYHDGLTCQEYKAQQGECQTEAYVRATTKSCPNCGARTSHFHGHQCHHIRPGGGCANCHIHWCYACGATEEENELERGGRSRCRCERSYWSTFCNSDDIAANVVQLPYPHDRRCGCQICPECRPGDSCAACDGTCVVCQGRVPPGPTELPTPVVAAAVPAKGTEAEVRRRPRISLPEGFFR